MNTTAAIAIIFLLLFTLSSLRNRLVFELQSISLLIFNNTSPGIYLYAIFFLPGTIIHELSHWITAEVLHVPTGKISILPATSGNDQEKQLGYVMTAKTDPIRGFIIGMAPVIVSLFALSMLGIYTQNASPTLIKEFSWQGLLLFYAFIVLGNTGVTSKSDRKHLPLITAIAILIHLALNKLQLSLNHSVQVQVYTVAVIVIKGLFMAFALSLLVITALLFIRKILEIILNKSIRRR